MNITPSGFEETLKLIAALGAVASFIWGVWVWDDKSKKELVQAEKESLRLAESRRIESTKPFLERQLALYTEASQVAAVLATSIDDADRRKAKERFWKLYWGELALVENSQVEASMVELGDALKLDKKQVELQQLSLNLAKACRNSLDRSWGVHAWSNPDEASNNL